MKTQTVEHPFLDHEGPSLTFGGWLKNVWTAVSTVAKGMGITIRYVLTVKPVTIEYPEVREALPENSRSRLFNDADNCISCLQCANVCPVDCIYITATRREKDAPPSKPTAACSSSSTSTSSPSTPPCAAIVVSAPRPAPPSA